MMNLDLAEDVAHGLEAMSLDQAVDRTELGNSLLRELLTSMGYLTGREKKHNQPRKTSSR